MCMVVMGENSGDTPLSTWTSELFDIILTQRQVIVCAYWVDSIVARGDPRRPLNVTPLDTIDKANTLLFTQIMGDD